MRFRCRRCQSRCKVKAADDLIVNSKHGKVSLVVISFRVCYVDVLTDGFVIVVLAGGGGERGVGSGTSGNPYGYR